MSTLARNLLILAISLLAFSNLSLIINATKASKLLLTQIPIVQSSTEISQQPMLIDSVVVTQKSLDQANKRAVLAILAVVGLCVIVFFVRRSKKSDSHKLTDSLEFLLKEPSMKAILQIKSDEHADELVLINQLLARYRNKIQDLEEVKAKLVESLEDILTEPQTDSSTKVVDNPLAKHIQKLLQHSEFASNTVGMALELAKETKIKSQSTKNDLLNSFGSMKNNLDDVQIARGLLDKLKNSSESISKSVGRLDKAIEDTGVVVVNASIEAARAGESGSGLANVANDLKILSEQIIGASKDVVSCVKSLQIKSSQMEPKLLNKSSSISGDFNMESLLNKSFDELERSIEKIHQLGKSVSETLGSQSKLTHELQNKLLNDDDINNLANKPNAGLATKLQQLHDSLSGMNF